MRSLWAALVAAAGLWAGAALAAEGPSGSVRLAQAAEQAREFQIPAGSLSAALIAFGDQAGVQFSVDSAMVAGKQTTGLSGRYTVDAALRALLAGSGLSYRFSATNTVVIEKAPAGTRLLGPVQVQGVASNATGANGSSDPTATEGTGSYTTSAMTVGSKVPLSIRQTPQDVSVVTQQQMQDQNLTDLNSVLNEAPGISMVTGSFGPLNPSFYARGLPLTNFQFDGGTPLNYLGSGSGFANVLMPDMAEFDHIELLQGADGMFAGAGVASGTVNLVRKRPLDHDQLLLEGDVGSWNNERAVMDVTGPLNIADLGDKVRARLVMTYQTQDYFYQTASANHAMIYGVVEVDVTPTTLMTLGGSFLQEYSVPSVTGLPRYQSGASLNLPRSTSLTFPWNYWNFNNPELFARVDQRINDDWTARFDFTDVGQSSQQKIGYIYGGVNPDTLGGPIATGFEETYSSHQYLFDFIVNGKFQLFGREHQIVVGASYQDVNANNSATFSSLTLTGPPVNVFSFDPSAYPDPAASLPTSTNPLFGQKQYGVYATLRFQVLDDLHLMAGARLSGYSFLASTEYLNSEASFNNCCGPQTQRYSSNGVVTPYGAIVYDFARQWSAYVSYTSIYQSQSDQLQGPPPGTPIAPETGDQFELGVKGELLNGALNTSAAIYRINQRNVAVSDPNYPFAEGTTNLTICCYLADGNVESEGVDLEANGQILPGWQLSSSLAYNFNRTIYDGTAADVNQTYTTITPKWLFKLWTTYQLPNHWNRWTIGGGVNAQSSTFVAGSVCSIADDMSGHCAGGTYLPYKFTQASYAVVSARIAYKVDDHWSLALNANNILDATYYQTVGTSGSGNWYGDPRNFMVTVRGNF